MKAAGNPSRATQCLYALLLAISLVCLIDARTNSMPPRWDAEFYLDMARSGVVGNPRLVAPYAYRPGMPVVARVTSDLLSVPMEYGFRLVARVSAVCLLMAVFMLSRHFAGDYRHALVSTTILGLSVAHVKFPLFCPALVDVSAYPLIVVAFWALITKRLRTCLVVSCLGLLFKEFLAIPWVLLCLHQACACWRCRSRRDLAFLVVALAAGLSVILIPRLCLPVAGTVQFVDPVNDVGTLGRLISVYLDELRMFNVMFAVASYWLPTWLLLTPGRFRSVWADLRGSDLRVVSGYVALVLLLTMYGGTNISIFMSYSLPAQAVVLALLLRCRVSVIERVYVVAVVLLYNKILLPIPMPEESFDAYIDFYGGWSSRVTLPTLIRFMAIGLYVMLAACVRIAASGLRPEGPPADPDPQRSERSQGLGERRGTA